MSDEWEQRKGETNKQYRAFCDYLDMGEGRALEALRDEYRDQVEAKARPKPPTVRLATLKQWSADSQWVKRVKAYDAYLIAEERAAREAARMQAQIDIVETEHEDYRMLRGKWLEIADKTLPVSGKQEIKSAGEGVPDKVVVTLRTEPHRFRALVEARKAISTGLRLAAEMPDKIERHEQTGKDGGDLFAHLLKAIQAAEQAENAGDNS